MAAMAAVVPLLTTLSLNTNIVPAPCIHPGQPAPPCHTTAASQKSCARTKLRLFKQAAKAKFRRGFETKMSSRPARNVVIEISDDDSEDELPNPQRLHVPVLALSRSENSYIEGVNEDEQSYPQRPPTRAPLLCHPHQNVVEGNEGADSDNYSDDSDASDLTPPHRRHQPETILQHPRPEQKVDNRSISSATMSEDSGDMPISPRRKRTTRGPHSVTTSVFSDDDASYSTPPPIVPQPTVRYSPTKTVPNAVSNGSGAVHKVDPCPYYYDYKLDVKMYRGEGYERFPVVLGTVEGHKEICEEWDAQAASRSLIQDMHPADTGPSLEPTRSIAELDLEDACLQAVLQVFPEIEHDFVRNMYRRGYSGAGSEHIVGIVSGALIADIAESETYPKQKKLKRKASLAPRDETGVIIGWNKDLRKNREYSKEAVILLATVFDHIPTHYIFKVVHEKQSLFDAFGCLSERENNFYNARAGERPYKRLRQPRRTLELKYQRKNLEQRDGHLYVSLVNELQAARQSEAREACRIKRQKASDDFESENLALHVAQGSMVECQCCFEEKPINRAVPCEGEEAHFFCNDCVRRQAESQIGAMKYQMLCMDTDGCKAELSTEGVAQAIPLQLFDKLAFNQQQAEISSADLQGLEMCPFCDFKAICEPVEIDTIFDCQNPDCGLVTCRKCKERAHLPKTCEEIKDDKGLGARHKVEEARSEAMMRTCPKCKVKLIKEYGCNKMVCTNCYAVMCYICQKDISGKGKEQGYDHFHRAGATCALHDLTGVDRHDAEANAAELAAIENAKAEYEGIDEKALQIETGKNKEGSTATEASAMAPALQLRGIRYHPFLPVAHMAPLPVVLPFPAVPQLPALPQREPLPLPGQMHQVLQPNFQHVLPPDQGPLPGQMQQDRNRMQLLGQEIYGQPHRQAGPALAFDHGMQQREALQMFLQQRRRNRA